MPIGHISLPCGLAHFEEMRAFYLAILQPLGYKVYKEDVPKWCGLGTSTGGPDFWLHCGGKELSKFGGDVDKREGGVHVAFNAASRRAVDEWYRIALYD